MICDRFCLLDKGGPSITKFAHARCLENSSRSYIVLSVSQHLLVGSRLKRFLSQRSSSPIPSISSISALSQRLDKMTPSDNESNSLLFEWKPQVPVRNTPDGITVSNLFKNTQTIEALPQITGNPLGDCTRFHGASGGLQFKLVPGDEGRVWFESLQDGKECKFAYVDEVYSSAARNVYIGILHPDLFSDGCMILASQLIRLNERYDSVFSPLEFPHLTGVRQRLADNSR